MKWDSPNQHDVATDIEQGKHDGRYKDCSHLGIGGGPNDIDGGAFRTSCSEDCLRYPRREALSEPACPTDCRLFVDRAQAEHERKIAERRARWIARLKWPWTQVMGFLGWYGKAPWQTQAFLALIVLVVLAPVYAKALAELLKAALHGK